MRTRTKALLAAGLLVIVALIGGIWWFLRDDAPDEVSLDDAVRAASATVAPATTADAVTVTTDAGATTAVTSVAADTTTDTTAAATTGDTTDASTATTGATGSSEAAATAGDDPSGTWDIDPDFGEFDYESATGSFVGFRIEEELRGIGSTTAVGRTGDVTGSITIEATTLTAAEFEVDLTTITTNDSRRDDRVQSALDTGEFPTATFTLTEPVDLGEAAATGGDVAVTAAGDLTIHGVTNPITIDIEARVVDDRIALVGSTEITFSDYDVAVPEAPIVVSAEDNGTLELQFILERA